MLKSSAKSELANMRHLFPTEALQKCKTYRCLFREMKLDNGTLPNCTYRYISTDPQTTFARWVDGPCTSLAAILALTGTVFAAKFLWKAGLNKHLTAALFSLCIVDSLLMCTVIFSYSIEAIGMVFLGTNVMYKNQGFTTSLHGVASSMTTSSTLLVIYITFQRFMVVIRPLRYANALQERSTRSTQRRMTQISIPGLKNRKEPSSGDSTQLLPTLTPMDFVRELDLRKILKPYLIPLFVVLLSFAINIPVHFEFTIEPCWDWDHKDEATCPAATLFREDFARYKAVLNTLTQTVGPVATISLLTLLTEMKVHRSLKERRKLFESQKRSRAVVLTEELKEKVSRTVSIFIAVKFLILRSMPVFFDVWENMYGIQSFGVVLSILVRVSDFMIVLNSATNSLAYFGRKRWLERRLRLHMMKKEEKRARQLSVSGAERNDSRRQSSSQVAPRLTVSCTPSVCPPGMARGKTTQSCRVSDSKHFPNPPQKFKSEDFSDSEVTGEKMKFIKYPLRLSKKEDSKCSNTSVSSIPTSPLVKEVMNGSHPVITQTYSNSLNGCHSPNQSRKTTDGRPLSALSGTSNPSSTSRHSPNPC